jgi:23S rRNA G2445 N2-methylase RlmL
LDDPELKTNYWKRPDVWPDIEKAFDRFFELNPNETAYYHNYAWYAYQCQQWEKFNELVPKLDQVNYDYFGGKDEFDKMVQFARENVKASKLGEQK